MRGFLGIDVLRWSQLVTCFLGLLFSILSDVKSTALIVVYSITLLYIFVVFITHIAGRSIFSSIVSTVIELILAGIIVAYTIYFVTRSDKDIWFIMSVVTGFVLPALFFVTAWERSWR